jgi:phage tail-like protein
MYLRGGGDGESEPGEEQFRGSAADPIYRRTGLVRLAENPEISLLAIPDDVHLTNLKNDVLQQCEFLKDRFAVLSAPQNADQGEAASELPYDDANGAYYLPWIRVTAPHTSEGHQLVPATGHIAGMFARVDAEHGVARAPSGESILGTVAASGTLDAVEYTVNELQQQELNSRGINVIRYSSDEAVQVRGARTMSSDPNWKYVNVRRLAIFLERSLHQGTQWAVFEPNSEQTWTALRRSITAFLHSIWRKGALAGAHPEEAFFVKCDQSTMTQDDLEGGRLVCLVGIAPVQPAEFVILKITQHMRKKDDWLSSFNFLVEIGDIRAGFSEVDGLDADDHSPQQIDGDEQASRRKLTGLRKYTNLAMKRGVMGSNNLWNMNRLVTSFGTITLRNAPQKIVWRFSRAWLEGCLDPAPNSNEVRELKILVQGLEVDDHGFHHVRK